MTNHLTAITVTILLILLTIHISVQVYEQFRLSMIFNYQGYQWCQEIANEMNLPANAIGDCRDAFKAKFQLPIREPVTSLP